MTKEMIFLLLLAIAVSVAAAVLKGGRRRRATGDLRQRMPLTEREQPMFFRLQKNMSAVQVNNAIPPSPLPEKAPRFQLTSPLKGTGLAALAAASGQSRQVPTCEGAIMTANGRDTSLSQYGEGTTFFACVMPYQGGYSVNIYSTFTKAQGGYSAASLGAALARTVTGDSSQFIPRTINDIVNGLKATGATATLAEAYP